MDDSSELVSDLKACEVLGLKAQTLRNWRHQRKGPPYIKLGRAIRYDLRDLRKFAEKRRIVP